VLNQASGQTRAVDENALPSWVPNWEIYKTHILSEPTSPYCTHGTVSPTLKIDRLTLVLSVHGPRLDVIDACSKPLTQREFHLDSSGRAIAIETLWRDIGGKNCFDLEERYINGESAFFAYTQTLSNGYVAASLQKARPYHKIPKSE
jgi:hypothetical protein